MLDKASDGVFDVEFMDQAFLSWFEWVGCFFGWVFIGSNGKRGFIGFIVGFSVGFTGRRGFMGHISVGFTGFSQIRSLWVSLFLLASLRSPLYQVSLGVPGPGF